MSTLLVSDMVAPLIFCDIVLIRCVQFNGLKLSRSIHFFLTVTFYVQEQFKNLYGPSSSSFQMFSYVFFKSRIVLKESEEQVRYSRSDSIMKGEPLFSA